MIEGQYNLFDNIKTDYGPCGYKFNRYIGQTVRMRGGAVGKITKIESYYTYVKDVRGAVYAGTPSTITPIEEWEKAKKNGTLNKYWE